LLRYIPISAGAQATLSEQRLLMLRDDENTRLREPRSNCFHQLEGVAAAQSQVQQQEVGLVPLDRVRRCDHGVSFGTDEEILFATDQLDQALAKKRVIIDYDDACGSGWICAVAAFHD
jgi:hypothetical protein